MIPPSGSRHTENSAPWSRIAEAFLDWLVPSAYAANLTASSDSPAVFFDDTNSSFLGNEFVIACEGNSGAPQTTNICDFSDLENFQEIWFVRSAPSLLQFGIGTFNPTEALHVATPQTPRILLDSAGTDLRISSGNDITFELANNPNGAGNVTGPILTLEDDLSTTYPGLGVWQIDPRAPLQVGSHDKKSAKLIVENNLAPTAAGDVEMFLLNNPGPKTVRFVISGGGSAWTFDNSPSVNPGAGNNSGQFRISKLGTGVAEFTVDGFGNGTFVGTSTAVLHINTSSRKLKSGFTPIDKKAVLEQVAELPITRWQYQLKGEEGVEHIGPVAEDFQATFGLGDGEHIATVDADGVALAAIQGLYRVVREKEAQIEALQKDNAALATRLSALEKLVLAGQHRAK